MGIFSIFSKEKKQQLDQGLSKTKESVFTRISKAIVGKSRVDDDVLDNLEEILVTSDVGVDTTLRIIERIQSRIVRDKYVGTAELNTILKEEIAALLAENESQHLSDFTLPDTGIPYVILVVGVNGVGKTTTIGKLAYQYKKSGYEVLLGAADTYRAAAIDQLAIWADRAGCDVVKGDEGADPSSVVYTAVDAARTGQHDVVIIDTAGRLHNRANLMQELGKMARVIGREFPGAPHETLLVLDASTGQNALQQARQFTDICGVTGIILTKMDGTAKGGVIIGIHDQLKIPVKFIGIGEKIDDLEPFDSEAFLKALFEREEV